MSPNRSSPRNNAAQRLRQASMTAPLLATALMVLFACSGGCSSAAAPRTPRVVDDPVLRDARIREDIEALRAGVEAYYARYGTLPERLPDLRDTPDGEPLVERLPRDPWSVPYLVRRLDRDVLIFSTGEDLLIGTEDDQGVRISFEGVETPGARVPERRDSPPPFVDGYDDDYDDHYDDDDDDDYGYD